MWLHYCCVLRREEFQGGYKYVTFFCCLAYSFWMFCHLSSGGNVFSLILCSYSPVLSCWHAFCAEQAHLYIGSDIPGDKCPCSVLWLCKIVRLCNLLSWSNFQTIISHEISITSVIVYCLSLMIGAFWTVVCSSTLQRVLCFTSSRSILNSLINVALKSRLK